MNKQIHPTRPASTPRGKRRRARLILAASAALLGIGLFSSSVRAQTEPAASAAERGAAVGDSTNPGATHMDQLDLTNQMPGQVLFPQTEPAKKPNPFIDDSKFSVQFRTYYFYRDKYDDSLSEAWAIGGSLSYKSGYLGDVFAIGAVGYTSQRLLGDDDRDGTLLLEPGQEGYTVLGQIYGEFKISDRLFAAIGRKEYNTPYVNKNDVRMTPNTFEGATFYGKAGGTKGGADGVPEWRFGGGYLTRIKERNDDDFVWMSKDAGSDADRGVFLLGANVDWNGLSIGAIDYYSQDIINIFYTEAKYSPVKRDGMEWKLAAQFTDQRSVGDELLTGGDFSTNQWGIKSDHVLGDATFTVAYTDVANGDDMRSPWGGYPGYTSVQVQDFFRAGEQAIMLRAAYDFSSAGVDGVSAYALWVHGFSVEDANNEDEFDLNLQWTPKGSELRGLSVRARYAYVRQRGDDDPDIQDLRLIVNYDFPNR